MSSCIHRHDAVGIENDEVAVGTPQRRQKSATLPALRLVGAGASGSGREALSRRPGRIDHARCELAPRRVLGSADLGIGRVAQDVDVEVLRFAGRDERFDRRGQAAEHRRNVLVADRHDDRGAHLRVERAHRLLREAAHERASAAAEEHHARTHHAGPEARRDPREKDSEQHEQPALCEAGAVLRQHFGHPLRAEQAAEGDQSDEGEPARHQRPCVVGMPRGLRGSATEEAAQGAAERRSGPGP
jgi:hypothetical protein